MKSIRIYTDGGCLGTPGKGAWAFIIRHENNPTIERCGGLRITTNNRMEIMAVLKGLSTALTLNSKAPIEIISDSKYVCNSINKWVIGWAKNNFEGKANADLWREYLRLRQLSTPITATWVRGHNGHIENEQCDTMCNGVMKSTNLAIDEVCAAKYAEEKRVLKKHVPDYGGVKNYKSNLRAAKKRWNLD